MYTLSYLVLTILGEAWDCWDSLFMQAQRGLRAQGLTVHRRQITDSDFSLILHRALHDFHCNT